MPRTFQSHPVLCNLPLLRQDYITIILTTFTSRSGHDPVYAKRLHLFLLLSCMMRIESDFRLDCSTTSIPLGFFFSRTNISQKYIFLGRDTQNGASEII